MQPGDRVQMMNVGGQMITGTFLRRGPTRSIRTMNPAEDQDIETAVVEWDEPAFGTETVATDGLEVSDAS
jgi:hypothetical protein